MRVRNKLPRKALAMSLIILSGIFLLQMAGASRDAASGIEKMLLGAVPVLIAAFAYPLGNRKMMAVCEGRLTTMQRVFGMTLCSMPFWMLLSAAALSAVGLPSTSQVLQSLVVALFSGVVATILFFKATELVAAHPHQLAVIESTQAGEVLFTVLGGVLVFHDRMPSALETGGLLIVITGMMLNSTVKS